MDPDLQTALTDLSQRTAGAIEANTAKWTEMEERLDAVEGRGQRIATEKSDAQRTAFEAFLRGGKASLTDAYRNALISSDDQQGGYVTAPKDVEAGILKEITELSPLRRLASVRSISAPGATQAKLIGDAEAWWVEETEYRKETGLRFGREDIPMHTMAAKIAVSIEHLQDGAYDVVGEIKQAFGRAFAKLESSAFAKGDGHKKPLGILNTPGIPVVKTGTAATVSADNLLDLAYDLPSAYADNGTYLANRASLGAVRKLKDASGAYQWQDSLQLGQPPAFNLRPMIEDPEMPGIGAGTKPFLFGDLRWFRIYDRVNSLQVLRDDFTLADNGLVLFRAQRRVGAGLVMPEAVRVLSVEV
ncbi:MAG TPA: phage major capsid protein [Devosia sp.]|nr:phage major capsid protein [Devosia sp.]